MSDTTQEAPAAKVFNVPNQLTAARLVLSIVVFVLIVCEFYLGAMIVFIVAASTDWIDGYWARRFNQVTKLGRVFDPFVDKILICGTFILLGAADGSGIEAWMAVVVFGREMLVTVLRSFIEQNGGDFSAKMAGKLKMVFQCATVVVSLWVLKIGPADTADWLRWTLIGLAWLAVLSTIQSGLGYVLASAKFFKE
jgi:CDP-diacylglycerol--glycerol-3-phosphate 3-phosphatidyltransferase